MSVFITIFIISNLTINIRSIVLKKDVNSYFKELASQNRQWVHRTYILCLWEVQFNNCFD